MLNLAAVSVIIPCRNEEKFISKCLDSLIKQNCSKENLEILVIDGMSEDRTRELVAQFSERHSFIKLLENSKKITPAALNIGIKNAQGGIIIRMDAHSVYREDYIANCVKYLNKYDADNVGGVLITVPTENTITAKAIILVLSCSFGRGNAHYRKGYSKGIRWVDTVFGGCYRKEIFKKIGYFNENLYRSQDMEFNVRLNKAGGKILLASDIVAYYYPKSNFKDFFEHNFNDGVWALYPLKFIKISFKLRHYIPLIFVLGLVITGILAIVLPVFSYLFVLIVGLYFLTSFYFSFKIAMKEKDARYLFLLPAVFANRHIGYGLGSLLGLLKLAK